GSGSRAFEKHVLDEVGNAVDVSGLAARTRFDPDAHGHRAQVIHALSQHDESIRQYSAAKISLVIHLSSGQVRFRFSELKRRTATDCARQNKGKLGAGDTVPKLQGR